MGKKIKTKGNVEVDKIRVGDVHYEYGPMGMFIKVEVIELPAETKPQWWSWKSKNVLTGKIVDYGVLEGHAHYAPELYDYEARTGGKQV